MKLSIENMCVLHEARRQLDKNRIDPELVKRLDQVIINIRSDYRELQKHEAHAESRSRRRDRGF